MYQKLAALLGALLLSASALAAVNLNSASQAELEALNGIGPAKAKAIVDYRTKNGPFKSVDDLNKVPGIGDKTMEALRKDVTVGGGMAKPATAPAAKPPAAAAGAKPAAPKP
ncbi:ComEA family DNA-binding protein [Crenobacter caeni]|uniref:Helix-hairpin-helix domain-containing protein n=1 Tax=Crenobacter caeni TaxID=2705474 RepID=A0A6B2KT17_9NEIS|nr:helix-hairpin-helix domain-containing protein [Crenobacter caeni]NDV13288.1 helix-hairpin-helix domain-containing protein [Crenobacter caeni]